MAEATVRTVSSHRQDDISANGDVKVVARMSDDSEVELFSYYSNELSFSMGELVGLTKEQAIDLKCRRDGEYLRGGI